VKRPTHNGFVEINVTIPDFQVETAIRIGANPCFIFDSCSLTAKIRQWHQVSSRAFLALGEIKLFHVFHLPTEFELFAVYTKSPLLARAYFNRFSSIMVGNP